MMGSGVPMPEEEKREPAEDVPPEEPANQQLAKTAPWHPPVALWQIYLLMVLSLGLYLPFWGMRLARDVRKKIPDISPPGFYFVGWLIGIAAPFVGYSQASQIRRLNRMAGKAPGPHPALILVLFLFTYVSGYSLESDPSPVWILHFLVVLPAPVLLMQRAVNRYKLTLAKPVWSSPPFRFTKLQYVVLAIGLVTSILVTLGGIEMWSRSQGKSLTAGELVRGESGLYTLRIPSASWKSMGATEFDEEADLSLYGPTVDTWVVAYVDRETPWDLDALVDARRELIAVSDIEMREERRLLPGSLVPISYAYYRGTNPVAGEQVWWVATVVTDDETIEVVASTLEVETIGFDVRELVHSFALTTE